MYMNFSKCNNKHEVMSQQAQYSIDLDNLIEFCYTELDLSEQQLKSLHEWHSQETERLGRLARQRLAQLGFTYKVQPEIM